jgi:hypothetical protein
MMPRATRQDSLHGAWASAAGAVAGKGLKGAYGLPGNR